MTLQDVVPLRGREGGQLTTRFRTPAASRYTATDLELPSLRLMLETSLGHCCGHLRTLRMSSIREEFCFSMV